MAHFEFIKDFLKEDRTYFCKRMFGGEAVYIKDKMVVVLFEGDETSYRGKEYEFPIWSGMLLPTFREHHQALISKYPELISHPVLGKWLYLSSKLMNFESLADDITQDILKGNSLFGIPPKNTPRKRKKKS